MIAISNGDQLVIPRCQSPHLQLCSMLLFDDIFPIANPCLQWHLKEPPDVFRDCFLKCAQMSDLSERHIFQLVRTTLASTPMMIQIPLVPNLEPLCEEAVNHCGCPIPGIGLLGGLVSNAITLSFYPLHGDLTFEQVSPAHGLLGCR